MVCSNVEGYHEQSGGGGGGGCHDNVGKFIIKAILFALQPYLTEHPHITHDSPSNKTSMIV